MDERPTQSERNGSCRSGWTDDEKRLIATIVYPLVEMQKAYGRSLDAKLVMQGWEIVLSKKFSAAQVCYALEKYALERGDDFPSPKNINEILDPPKPRITESEFIAAQDWQKRNGYPMFSDAKDVIDAYKAQEAEKREVFKIESSEIQALVNNSIKRISG